MRRLSRLAERHGSGIAVLAVALPLFLWRLGSSPFQDPDEGLFGSIAREMVASGDWLTPRFDGLRYLEKPPLYYWLTALTYAAAGPTEWGVRLWSALGAVGTALATARLGREAFEPRVGLVAGLLVATTLGVFRYGRFVGVDLLFTALLTTAVACGMAWARGGGRAPLLGLYLAVALATMTKGALGLALPAVPLLAVFVAARPRPPLRRLGLAWGLPLVALLVVPWHVLVARANPGFLGYFVVETHLTRFLEGTQAIEDEVPLSAAGFLLASLVWLQPWGLFLPSALGALAARWRAADPGERRAIAALGAWAGVVLAVFSLSAFKLEHYALPAFPPLLVAVAWLWVHAGSTRLVGIPLLAGAAVALLLAAAVIGLGPWLDAARLDHVLAAFDVYFRMLLEEGTPLPVPPPEALLLHFRVIALCLLGGFAGAAGLHRWGRPAAALACLGAGTVGLLATVGALIGEFAPRQTVRPVAEAIARLAAPGDLVLYEGYLENAGGLPFYTRRQVHVLGPARGDVAFGARFPEAQGLFHDPATLPALWAQPRRIFLVVDRPEARSAVAALPAAERHLLLADHARRLYSNRPR